MQGTGVVGKEKVRFARQRGKLEERGPAGQVQERDGFQVMPKRQGQGTIIG